MVVLVLAQLSDGLHTSSNMAVQHSCGCEASLDTSAGCSLTVRALLTGSCGVAADAVLSDRQSGSEAACRLVLIGPPGSGGYCCHP